MSANNDHIEELNQALNSAQPARVAAALCGIGDAAGACQIIERHGSNLGLWDLLQIVERAGLSLCVYKRSE